MTKLEKVALLMKMSKISYHTVKMKISTLTVEKTYPVFAGFLGGKVQSETAFVIGITKEFGPVKIPVGRETHNTLHLDMEISVRLKIKKIKKDGKIHHKVLSGKVLEQKMK